MNKWFVVSSRFPLFFKRCDAVTSYAFLVACDNRLLKFFYPRFVAEFAAIIKIITKRINFGIHIYNNVFNESFNTLLKTCSVRLLLHKITGICDKFFSFSIYFKNVAQNIKEQKLRQNVFSKKLVLYRASVGGDYLHAHMTCNNAVRVDLGPCEKIRVLVIKHLILAVRSPRFLQVKCHEIETRIFI